MSTQHEERPEDVPGETLPVFPDAPPVDPPATGGDEPDSEPGVGRDYPPNPHVPHEE